MATYTVAANELEGVILCFCSHHEASVPIIHHTLNVVYGVDLYATDFHFLFDDVPTNGQTELHKDAPKSLLDYIINHIKTESGLVGTRSKTNKVEELFKTTQLSYQMNSGTIMNFRQG